MRAAFREAANTTQKAERYRSSSGPYTAHQRVVRHLYRNPIKPKAGVVQ